MGKAQALLWDWPLWARPKQLEPPGDWLIWLLLAGRGFGKTRTGAEWVRSKVTRGEAERIALVARNPADARDIMIEGESGILHVSPDWERPVYEPSKRRVSWPNGASGTVYTSYEPDQLRGPQFDTVWVDELASFKYPQETWDNLMLATRLGDRPRVLVTATPKPISLIRDLISSPHAVIIKGTTFENRPNLTPLFYEQVIAQYENSRLGRQEIYADILDEIPGALWTRSLLQYKTPPELRRIVVAIDPAVTSSPDANETGIIVAGIGIDGRGYVVADWSCRTSPLTWAQKAITAFDEFHADKIIGEANNGGDIIETVLRTISRNIPYKSVHASRGKAIRAEPIVALYEQGRIFHASPLPALEDQMCTWTPDMDESPDRLDALVWALTELFPYRAEFRIWTGG